MTSQHSHSLAQCANVRDDNSCFTSGVEKPFHGLVAIFEDAHLLHFAEYVAKGLEHPDQSEIDPLVFSQQECPPGLGKKDIPAGHHPDHIGFNLPLDGVGEVEQLAESRIEIFICEAAV